MSDDTSLKGRTFNGTCISTDDPKECRIKVYIPELMHKLDSKTDGIWVINGCNNITIGENGASGNYSCIQKGSSVQVYFKENDFNSGVATPRSNSPHKNPIDGSIAIEPGKSGGVNYHSCSYTSTPCDPETGCKPVTTLETFNGNIGQYKTYFNYGGDSGGGPVESQAVSNVSQEGMLNYTTGHFRFKACNDINSECEGFYTLYSHSDCQINVDGTNFTTIKGNDVRYVESDSFYVHNALHVLNINADSHDFRNGNKWDTVIGNKFINTTGNISESQKGSRTLRISSDFLIQVDGELKISAQEIYLKGKSGIYIDGPPAYLNSGKASVVSVPEAPPAMISDVDAKDAVMVKGAGPLTTAADHMDSGPNCKGTDISLAPCGRVEDSPNCKMQVGTHPTQSA